MKVSKQNKILVKLIFSLLFSGLTLSYTSALQISKVSGPKTSPWIELYNDGDKEINIEESKLYTNYKVKPSAHSIKLSDKAKSFKVGAKGYFILADDPSKKIFENLDCQVFDTSFDLIIDEVLVFQDLEYPITTVESLDSTSCKAGTDSGSGENSTSTNSTTTKTDDSDNQPTEIIKYIYVPQNNQDKYGDIQVLIPETKVVMALADNEYKVSAIDSNRQKINDLIYHFSFGDGGEAKGQSAIYHYTYPGEYYLVASAEGFSGGAKAIMKVTVVPPEIRIVKVIGENNENYIGLSNYAKYDLYLSNFILNVNGKDYKLPEDLLLAKGKTTYLSGEAIGFILKDKKVSLFYPNHQLLDKYEINDEVSDSSTTNLLDTENIATTTILENKNLVKVIENSVKQSIVQTKSKLKAEIKDDNFKTIENIKEKEGEDENIAVITNNQEDILTLNRLILDIDNKIISLDKEENSNSRNKDKKIVKNNDKVDIGIINWFKNLLY